MHVRFLKQKAKEINSFYEHNEKRFDFIVKSIVSELGEVVKDKDNPNVYDELGDLFAVCFLLSDLIGGENFNASYFTNKSLEKIIKRHCGLSRKRGNIAVGVVLTRRTWSEVARTTLTEKKKYFRAKNTI